jgi:hypothetical protein
MANNFGALNDTPILHDFFAEFWGELLPLTNFVLDVQDPISGQHNAKPGDTIQIKNWQQAYTVYTVGATGYNAPTDVAPATVPFVLPATAKAVSLALTADEYRLLSTGRNEGADYDAFKKRVMNGALFALGSQMVTDMLAVITAANFPNNTVSAAGTFARSTETKIEEAFFTRKVPLDSPQILLPATPYREWVDDHSAILNNTGERVQKPMLFSGGIQSNVTPFNFARTHVAMPADAARGFAATRTAIIGALRVPDEPTWDGDPVSLATVVDDRTKAAVLTRMWKNSQTGGIQLDFSAIWKFQKGQPEALQRITLT